MIDSFPDRMPWYLAGPALGLLIVGLFMLANQPLGASGAYVQMSGFVRRKSDIAVWRVWYFIGMFLGGFLVTQVIRDGGGVHSGYDALVDVFPIPVVVPLVFVGAVTLGYGAAMAGGCTSGHGLCGTAQRSPASVAVTLTFMATGIATTFILRLLTGGAL